MRKIKTVIYLKNSQIQQLNRKGETQHNQRDIELIIRRVPILEDDTIGYE